MLCRCSPFHELIAVPLEPLRLYYFTNTESMKTPLPLLSLLLLTHTVPAQITTPVIKAGFGVDAELRANYAGASAQASDDWFGNGDPGTGEHVIDTSGAAAMYAQYLTDPALRKQPFFRTMRVPQYSVINNHLWIDAIYIRDYSGQSGDDETAFVSSNKNGQSPDAWTGGVTSVLNKNDISDMMIHVRRDGPLKTDSLWFAAGLSLQGTTGNRYFDFELYQTDIFYSRASGRFTNYGPDDGHTAWQFDASGAVTKPGDAIFTAEYSSSSLTAVQARVWIHKSALSITPAAFDWAGEFDGATNNAQFGYASIRPKTVGTYYTGLQSGDDTWAGPFGFIDGGNAVQITYTERQFMEFSVNLSKLGLDPIMLLGTTACGMPFQRVLVKTRSSTSFSSELKDFIGSFDFFRAPAVAAQTNVPLYCGPMGISDINVVNPLPSSVYNWSSPDGHFTDPPSGTAVRVDRPGTYIVTQQLLDGCSAYASDTVVIVHDASCKPMEQSALGFTGVLFKQEARLQWRTTEAQFLKTITIQRSFDGKSFQNIHTLDVASPAERHQYADALQAMTAPAVYYRLALRSSTGALKYSPVVRLEPDAAGTAATLYPNPAATTVQLSFYNEIAGSSRITVRNASGTEVYHTTQSFSKGHALVTITTLANWAPGLYIVGISAGGKTEWLKLMINPKTAGMK
jgi:hypothetical protein